MSNAEASTSAHTQQQQPLPRQPDVDFWEFVNCAKCHLVFSLDGVSGPSVPFWLTECGHIVCNTHLNANQSCAVCGTQKIELMPLQKDLEPPMSDWFCPLPYKIDSIAQAAKFQQDILASSVRYYKNKCGQYRQLSERLKTELSNFKALKREVEALKQENEQLRRGHGLQEPGTSLNANGKRRMVDAKGSMSSPRSIHTPLGPPRITLPPDHDPPPSVPKNTGSEGSRNGLIRPDSRSQARPGEPPGSRGFNQQYAYIPPQTPQLQQKQLLSYAQLATAQHASGSRAQTGDDRRRMPPPPTPQHVRQAVQSQVPTQRLVLANGHTIAQPLPEHSNVQGHRTGVPTQPRADRQHQLNPVLSSHMDTNSMIDPSYRGLDHTQTLPQNFVVQTQIQQHDHPVIPPMSSHLEAVNQTPRRFKPSAFASNGLRAAGSANGASRRFAPPTPVTSQRFVPSAGTQVYKHNAAAAPLTVDGHSSSAGHHPKRFVPSRTVAPSTASVQEQQPHGQRMAFTPRKNRFS